MQETGLCSFSGTCFSSAISKQFVLVKEMKTFDDAQMYCRWFHDDLASVEDAADFSRLPAVTDPGVWIGLKRGEPDWFWSLSDSTFYGEGEAEYRRWNNGQLDNWGTDENCVVLNDAGEFWDISCTTNLTFICYDGKELTVHSKTCLALNVRFELQIKVPFICITQFFTNSNFFKTVLV